MGVAEDMGVGILCDEATYNFASSSTKLGFQPLPPGLYLKNTPFCPLLFVLIFLLFFPYPQSK
jgi:hypothetical protein